MTSLIPFTYDVTARPRQVCASLGCEFVAIVAMKSLFTYDVANLFTYDVANPFTYDVTNPFTYDVTNPFTYDVTNPFTARPRQVRASLGCESSPLLR